MKKTCVGESAGPPKLRKHERWTEMRRQRSCAWLAGPKHAELTISAAKWWLAISRDVFAKSHRSQSAVHRLPVACHLTPRFDSPLAKRS
jgi:hypothetical protein